MAILVIAEHDNRNLKTATLNAVAAAQVLGDSIDILVAGFGCETVATETSRVPGIKRVRLADNKVYANQLAENVAPLIAEIAPEYSHVLMSSTTTGKNIIPRAAALIDVQSISDVITVEAEDIFRRPIYAGNIIATVKSNDVIKLMTIRTTAFNIAVSEGGSAAVETLSSIHDFEKSEFIRNDLAISERPELTSAKIVISGGRGMGSSENFGLLEKIADKLGAAVGASRAAVDAGFVPNDMQVGQTGKIVAPELYIAVGISGAIQHLAGMKDSKVIVAINKDPDAPIFQVADYGLVADLFDVMPEIDGKLSEYTS